MTKNEIITVAKCCIVDNCGPCPLMGTDNCITGFMNHILEYMKNEPAPAATGTSSEVSVKIPITYTLMITQKGIFVKHIIPLTKPAQICSLSTKECRNVSREPLI